MNDDDFFGGRWDKRQMFQARRGDMRGIILKSLKDQPMHGYEIIRSLEEASNGMWRPSPGSIYPTLTLLEEEDMVVSQEEQGKKIYTLTKAGEEAADKAETETPWSHHGSAHFEDRRQYRKLIHETMKAMRTVVHSDDENLTAQLGEILQTTHDQMVDLASHVKKGKK